MTSLSPTSVWFRLSPWAKVSRTPHCSAWCQGGQCDSAAPVVMWFVSTAWCSCPREKRWALVEINNYWVYERLWGLEVKLHRKPWLMNDLYYIYVYLYIYIAAEVIWYKLQMSGCSYLVLQSCHVFWVWPRSPMPHLFSIAKCFACMATLFSGCSYSLRPYLVSQASYDVSDKPGYATILLSI